MLTSEQQLEIAHSLATETNLANAYTKLQEAFGEALYGRVRFKVNDPVVIHDVISDTWIEVMKNIHKYDETRGELYSFIRLCANRIVALHYKKIKNELKAARGDRTLMDDAEMQPELAMIMQQTAREQLRKYNLLLAATLRVGGQAHHILAFGFSEIIFPIEKKEDAADDVPSNAMEAPQPSHRRRPLREIRLSGYPRRVVCELSDTLLRQLGQSFEEKYEQYSVLPKQVTASYFQQLHLKMTRPVRAGNLIVGDTFLRTYYGKDPEHNVSDWAYKVRQKVKKFILMRKQNEWKDQ